MKPILKTGLLAILLISFPALRAQDDAVKLDGGSAQTASAEGSGSPAQAASIIPAGQKFIMELDTDLHTRTTRKGDRVSFKTAAEIFADNNPAVATGATIRGTVTKSKRAGLLFGHAEINLRFDELLLPDGTALPLRATITRVGFDPVDPQKEGESEIKGESGSSGDAGAIAKAGAQGAIIGVLTAGGKGAMYGSAAGAAIAAAGMLLRRGPDIDLPRSTMLEARLDSPLEIPVGGLPRRQEVAQQTEAPGSVEAASSGETVSQEAAPADIKRPVLRRRPGSEPQETSVPPVSEPEATGSGSEPEEASVTPPAEPIVAAAKETPPEPASSGADFSVRVQMVLVDAVVKNRNGRMIDNLKQDDFKVYEDGVLQELQSFSFDELPLAVAVVVDRSGSVAPYISELRRIATRALQQLKPADQVALFSFAGSVDRIESLTTDRQRIAQSIARIQAGGGTNINDALFEAASYLGKAAPDRRHAIILVSDNQPTVNPRASDGEVIREAMEADTVVYSIKTQGITDPLTIDLPSLILGGDGVNKIARETGGEVLKASGVSSLDNVLGSVISRLRMRYSLGYYPSNTSQGGAFHAIMVRLDERHGKPGTDYFVHARRGYYSTSGRLR